MSRRRSTDGSATSVVALRRLRRRSSASLTERRAGAVGGAV